MQKSKIIELLQAKGHTVGFMGDGIKVVHRHYEKLMWAFQ